MNWRRLPALFVLSGGISGRSRVRSRRNRRLQPVRLGEAERLREAHLAILRGPHPADRTSGRLVDPGQGWQVSTAALTSPSDIAAYLWSTLAAEDLKIIGAEEAADRLGRTLASLVKLERSHGFFYNWYDPRDGSPLKVWPGGGPVRPFLSTVDNGWLAVALMMVRNTRPAFREVAEDLLSR